MDILDKDALLDSFLEEQEFKKRAQAKSKLQKAREHDEVLEMI